MPNEIYWEKDDPQVLHIRFWDKVNEKDYEETIQDALDEIEEIASPIYLIIESDLPKLTSYIHEAMENFAKVELLRLVIYVDKNIPKMNHRLSSIAEKFLPNNSKTRFTKTLESALVLIANDKTKIK